ncbi:hypothetical protein ABZ912_15305 [Nonomuraea angiospora]|uniref:hypothetical protein n=1 Tax=Nonomuraea angiospora TaxID=46172 RepID=UPI00340AE0EC
MERPRHPATVAAKAVVRQRYGKKPHRTFVAGISNGGYLVRWQLENRGWLYDGGVDWEGTLWRVKGDNLLNFLPPALKAYPDEAGVRAAGFAAGSEFLWPFHRQYYWELTQQLYQKELDPSYQGAASTRRWSARTGRSATTASRAATTWTAWWTSIPCPWPHSVRRARSPWVPTPSPALVASLPPLLQAPALPRS